DREQHSDEHEGARTSLANAVGKRPPHQLDVAGIRLERKVEQIAEERDGADKRIETDVEQHPGENRSRQTERRSPGDDVEPEQCSGRIADSRNQPDQPVDADADISGQPDRAVEQVRQPLDVRRNVNVASARPLESGVARAVANRSFDHLVSPMTASIAPVLATSAPAPECTARATAPLARLRSLPARVSWHGDCIFATPEKSARKGTRMSTTPHSGSDREIQQELERAKSEASHLASSTMDTAKQRGHEAIDRAKEQAADRAEELASALETTAEDLETSESGDMLSDRKSVVEGK